MNMVIYKLVEKYVPKTQADVGKHIELIMGGFDNCKDQDETNEVSSSLEAYRRAYLCDRCCPVSMNPYNPKTDKLATNRFSVVDRTLSCENFKLCDDCYEQIKIFMKSPEVKLNVH